jgi:hypothetical protein
VSEWKPWLGDGNIGWRPHDINWRTAVLFMIGSFFFALGSAPGFSSLAAPAVCGAVFFIGSLFFTSAGFSQFVQTINTPPGARHRRFAVLPARADWWAAVIQSIGTLWFNINTFDALREGLSARQQDLRIWTPDFVGSVCFLVASELAIWVVCRKPMCVQRRSTDWYVAAINMVGSIFFMLSALAAFVLPDTGDLVDATLANSGTFLGALCFFWAARLLVVAEPRVIDQAPADFE